MPEHSTRATPSHYLLKDDFKRGFELGLNPDTSKTAKGDSAYAYWGVGDCKAAYQRLLELGAKPNTPVEDVGGGILAATVTDPWGNVFGVIENPHFKLEDAR